MDAKDQLLIRSTFGQKDGIRKQLNMHIVASYDKQRGYAPAFGQTRPEKVVLRMITSAARQSMLNLMRWMAQGQILQEGLLKDGSQLDSTMFSRNISSRFNVVLKFNRDLLCKFTMSDNTSKTEAIWQASLRGPKAFHTRLFSNLSTAELNGNRLTFRLLIKLLLYIESH
jgi:hypothetical protein